MSKLGLAAVAALLVLGIAASTASAQSPTVIEAVDSPGPAFAAVRGHGDHRDDGPLGVRPGDRAAHRHFDGANWDPPLDDTRDPGGAPSTRTFNAPGTYTFLCKIHGDMTGTVTVE